MSSRVFLIILGVITGLSFIVTFIAVVFIKSKSFKNGTVVSSRRECARIGGRMLRRQGSFADAAIAVLFCESILQPQKMGVGGGFLAIIYMKSNLSSSALIAQETSPRLSDESNETLPDPLAIAVPGEIKGYFALHKKYGRLNWSDLVNPAIKICETGFKVDKELATSLKEKETEIKKIASLKEAFINPATGNVYEKGDLIKDILLAKTLKIIARDGENAIYNGGIIGKQIVEDIRTFGGIITEDDLRQYKHTWTASLTMKFLNTTIHTMPSPGGGHLLKLALNDLRETIKAKSYAEGKYGLSIPVVNQNSLNDLRKVLQNKDIVYRRYVDSKTFNVLEYLSTSETDPTHEQVLVNVAILTPDGNAIAVTSTLHSRFGAMRRSPQTGIIFNDQMRNYFVRHPVSTYSHSTILFKLYEQKTSLISFLCPAIITDTNGFPRIIIGSFGGYNTTITIAKIIKYSLKRTRPRKKSVFKLWRSI